MSEEILKAWLVRKLNPVRAMRKYDDLLATLDYQPGDEIWEYDDDPPPETFAGETGIVIIRDGKQVARAGTSVR